VHLADPPYFRDLNGLRSVVVSIYASSKSHDRLLGSKCGPQKWGTVPAPTVGARMKVGSWDPFWNPQGGSKSESTAMLHPVMFPHSMLSNTQIVVACFTRILFKPFYIEDYFILPDSASFISESFILTRPSQCRAHRGNGPASNTTHLRTSAGHLCRHTFFHNIQVEIDI
jgi:hypothetical protein